MKGKKVLKDKTVQRVVFNAITKSAVLDAMRNPRDIDTALVDAYLARRALDYLVGFNLSPVLWRKLPGARSAGRVQSVALRLVCERELAIEEFKAREYWSIAAHLKTPAEAPFVARLVGADGTRIGRLDVATGEDAAGYKGVLERARFRVTSVEAKPARRNPAAPFTTSTLQQEASRKLGLAPARTMQLAQRLYEGVEIQGETVGFITYMRTDGVDMAPEAVAATRRVIGEQYGKDYVPSAPRKYTVKAKNAQEAHEAVRPTDLGRLPKHAARHLDAEQAKLYELIWTRTVASQMESAELERTTIDIAAEADGRTLELRATGQVVRFDGFLKLYQEGRDDEDDEESGRLPAMKAGDAPKRESIEAVQHFTEPPPRFTEATLVKRMEELGIGRPSTYAATLGVLARPRLRAHRQEAPCAGGQGAARHRLSRKLLRPLRRLRFHRRPRAEARSRLQSRGRLEERAARVLDGFFRRARRDEGSAHHPGARQPERGARAAYLPGQGRRVEPARLPLLRPTGSSR